MQKLVLIVRLDINTVDRPKYIIPQVIHAGINYCMEHKPEEWFEKSNTVVCLGINNEKNLSEFKEYLDVLDIKNTMFFEPDIKQYTSLAFITDDKSIYKHLKTI